jgi:long-chain acyl-CoA synthetase
LELDLGIDSLGRIELLLELEKLLGLEVSDSLAEELFYANTIKDLILKVKDFLPDKFKLSAEKKFNWSEILCRPPTQDTVKNIRLTPYFLDKVFTCIFYAAFQFFFRAFFLLEVRGKSNFPAKGPFLMYPNHTSYLDGFIIATSIPFRLASSTYFVGFKKYFLHPVFKNLVKTARLVPIDITLELVEAMQAYAYLLKNSKIICFFPEGQRHIGEDVGPFKKGIGIIAKEVNIPLVPVYIEGAFRSWPRFALLPHPSKIRVTIGKPIMPSELLSQTTGKSDVYESIAELLRDRLISLKEL